MDHDFYQSLFLRHNIDKASANYANSALKAGSDLKKLRFVSGDSGQYGDSSDSGDYDESDDSVDSGEYSEYR